jgi:hypothetical protein
MLFVVISFVSAVQADDYYVIRGNGEMKYLYNINLSNPKLVKTSTTEKVEENPLKIVKGKMVLIKTINRVEEQTIVSIDSFSSFTLTRGQHFYPDNYDTTIAIDTVSLVVAMRGVYGQKLIKKEESVLSSTDEFSFLPKTYIKKVNAVWGERNGCALHFYEATGRGVSKIYWMMIFVTILFGIIIPGSFIKIFKKTLGKNSLSSNLAFLGTILLPVPGWGLCWSPFIIILSLIVVAVKYVGDEKPKKAVLLIESKAWIFPEIAIFVVIYIVWGWRVVCLQVAVACLWVLLAIIFLAIKPFIKKVKSQSKSKG